MARSHWRFIVRDAYGYALQNARVYVYQPGTTTAFLGAAYTAASGGSAVTSPQLTGPQGEVEAWFDTAQDVDVFVDDNADAAYRATDGAGTIVSFTAFTERDEIPRDIADSPNTLVGVAGDLVLAITNPFTSETAAAGAVGKYADSGHKHPYTALTPAASIFGKTAGAAGTLTNPARSDHIHPLQIGSAALSTKLTKTTAAEEVIGFLTIPANTAAALSQYRITAAFFQTNGTTAVTFTFNIRWGGLAGVLLDTVVLVGTTTAHTDLPMFIDALVTVRTIGATGTAICTMHIDESVTNTTASTAPRVGLSTQQASQTIDTTANKDLALTANLSVVTGAPDVEIDSLWIGQVA